MLPFQNCVVISADEDKPGEYLVAIHEGGDKTFEFEMKRWLDRGYFVAVDIGSSPQPLVCGPCLDRIAKRKKK